MTENEAIKKLLELMSCNGYKSLREARAEAIKALEEVQQYRALGSVEQLKNQKQNLELAYKIIGGDSNPIGTLEEIRAAVEKQNPKRPDYEGDGYADGQLVYDTWICPSCGEKYEVEYDDYDHCPKCGQAIDWTEGGG